MGFPPKTASGPNSNMNKLTCFSLLPLPPKPKVLKFLTKYVNFKKNFISEVYKESSLRDVPIAV